MDLVQEAQTTGLVLDGSMSYELEKQGVDTANKLWTATALVNNLQAVYNTHFEYFKAGAQLTITDTYQANVQAFMAAGYSAKEAQEFIAAGVQTAKKARDDYEQKTGVHNYVAGTVGPYGAYLADGNEYRGDYDLTEKEYLDFHLPRLKVLLANQPDCIAIETQPKLTEVIALLDYLTANAADVPAYVSFTLHDDQTISDGTSLREAVAKVSSYRQVFAVGVNCVKPQIVTPAIEEIKRYTNKAIVVYPNLGASYNPVAKQWEKFDQDFNFTDLAREWYQHGAHLIGGCCTTGPQQIKEIKAFYETIHH